MGLVLLQVYFCTLSLEHYAALFAILHLFLLQNVSTILYTRTRLASTPRGFGRGRGGSSLQVGLDSPLRGDAFSPLILMDYG